MSGAQRAVNIRIAVCLGLLAALVAAGGCRNRGGRTDVTETATPTVTPLVEVQPMPTFTSTPIPDTPTPTPTSLPPTSTPAPQSQVKVPEANLRAGPGVIYPRTGSLSGGTVIEVVARSADGLWLELEDGNWIFSLLVEDIPLSLPLATGIPTPPPPLPTATPLPPTPTVVVSTPTPTPTPTPVPVEGDWSLSVLKNKGFLTRDFLLITVQQVYRDDNKRMQQFIELRAGQTCTGCLVVQLLIRNTGTEMREGTNRFANEKEYLARDDFRLLQDGPQGEEFVQLRCTSSNRIGSAGNPTIISRGAGAQGEVKVLCFEGVPEDLRHINLAYSPVYVHDPEVPEDATPTPTPVKGVTTTVDPEEKNQNWRTGWTVYFSLVG